MPLQERADLGDLNITQHHGRYEQLHSIGLVDFYDEVESGLGYTTPARLPILNEASQTIGDAQIPLYYGSTIYPH